MPSPNPTVLTDAYVAVNGTALTNWAHHVEVLDEADQVEVTGFSASGYRSYIPGLKRAQITVNFFQDFGVGGAGTNLDQTLQALYAAGGTFSLEVRPTESGRSNTNPAYLLQAARMYSYSPLVGDVGNASDIQVVFQNAGTAGLTRATA